MSRSIGAVVAVFSLCGSANALRPPVVSTHPDVAGVRLHAASLESVRGFARVLAKTPRPIYFATEAIISGENVRWTEAKPTPTGTDIALFLGAKNAARASGVLAKLGADQIVVFENGAFLGQANIDFNSDGDRVTLKGLSASQGAHIIGILGGARNGAPVLLKSTATAIQPGDEFTVDVFVDQVRSLGAYQVSLDATGGATGRIEITDLSIDAKRPDNVFLGKSAVGGIDRKGKRAGAALMDGSADADKPAYVATFKFRATKDAAGAFRIDVRTARGTTVFSGAGSRPIPMMLRPILISVGAQSAVPVKPH